MSYPARKQSAEERREYARLDREESRAAALGRPIGAQFDNGGHLPPGRAMPSATLAPSTPASAALPKPVVKPPPARSVATPFELVGELPNEARGRRLPNPVREALAAFARANPGQWIKYAPSPGDPFKSAASLSSQIRKGATGFGPGLDATVRGSELYVRYVGEGQ